MSAALKIIYKIRCGKGCSVIFFAEHVAYDTSNHILLLCFNFSVGWVFPHRLGFPPSVGFPRSGGLIFGRVKDFSPFFCPLPTIFSYSLQKQYRTRRGFSQVFPPTIFGERVYLSDTPFSQTKNGVFCHSLIRRIVELIALTVSFSPTLHNRN